MLNDKDRQNFSPDNDKIYYIFTALRLSLKYPAIINEPFTCLIRKILEDRYSDVSTYSARCT